MKVKPKRVNSVFPLVASMRSFMCKARLIHLITHLNRKIMNVGTPTCPFQVIIQADCNDPFHTMPSNCFFFLTIPAGKGLALWWTHELLLKTNNGYLIINRKLGPPSVASNFMWSSECHVFFIFSFIHAILKFNCKRL